MSTTQKLEAITKRIAEVVPGVVYQAKTCPKCKRVWKESKQRCTDPFCSPYALVSVSSPITLEDVLLWQISLVDAQHDLSSDLRKHTHRQLTFNLLRRWELGKPLSEQSPDTIDYIISLLPTP